ncbi:MAG: thermonuclease family protein [Planctomycetes bacterium]|nr:thermonuclease family protein [Planctomycetota bacterium]
MPSRHPFDRFVRLLSCAFALAFAGAPLAAQASSAAPAATTHTAAPVAPLSKALHAPPQTLFDVERVVDGDTLHIQRDGKLVKLRLLAVDTEEKLGVGTEGTSKPGTVFGEECAMWAQRFFADLAKPGEKPKIGLFFPPGADGKPGHEALDNYGRLLCHAVLPDGTDYNLMIVELGKSPYFNKYGNSTFEHEKFVAAQAAARKAELGIWNPATNRPATAGAPSAKRPYEKLQPWWDARAAAVDAFRSERAKDPTSVFDSDDPEELARAFETSKQRDVRVFGCLDRTFDEENGTLTLLFKTQDKNRALRVRITKEHRATFAALALDTRNQDFVQNYFFATGRVVGGSRGFEVHVADATKLVLAGPEPR